MRRFAALLAASAVWLAAGAHAVRAQDAEPTKPPPPAEAAPAPEFTLTAKTVNYDSERDLYEATGDVKIVQADGRVLTADWVLFNGTTRTGVASGDVVVSGAQNTVRAQFVAVDLRSTVSVALQGSMDNPVPGFLVHGEVIERTGVDTFEIERGNFTTCRCPPDTERRPWEIQAKEANVEVGGYAVAKDLWFKVLGAPVVYTPWLVFPVKTERQSGFILPGIGQSSRNGTEIELPFFWAVTDNLNLLLRPEWFGRHGFASEVHTEYVNGETGEGHGGSFVLPNDRKVKDSTTDFFSPNRWAYWLRHQQEMNFTGGEFGVDVAEISDNDVVFDFPRLLGSDMQHQRQVETAGWYTIAQNGWHTSGLVSVNNDIQNPNDLDRDGFFLQRVPDLRASTLPRAWIETLPLRAGMSMRYTNFVQFGGQKNQVFGTAPLNGQFFDTGEDGRFDPGEPAADGRFHKQSPASPDPNDPNAPIPQDERNPDLDDFNDPVPNPGVKPSPPSITRTEGDGLFEEGELLADAGNRLDFFPKLSLPGQIGIFEGLAEAGVRETLWFPNTEDDRTRTLYTLRGDVRTRFGRRYVIGTLPLEHVLEPRIAYAGVFAPNQTNDPLFIPSPARTEQRLIDGDIRLITDDPTDRVKDASLLQLQLGNLLYGPPRNEGGPPLRYGEFRFGTGYDFHKQAFTRLFALLDFNPSRYTDVSIDGGWDPQQHNLQDRRASFGLQSEAGHQLRLGYHYKRDPGPIFEGFQARGKEFGRSNTRAKKINQVDLATYVVATQWLELFAEGFTSLEAGGADGGRIGTVFISTCKCWDLLSEFEKTARTNEKRVFFKFRLTGLGDRTPATDLDRRKQVKERAYF